MSLKSPRFARLPRLQSASLNSPPLARGENNEAVKALQQALADLGFAMPISFGRTGSPDGIYGDETVRVVSGFQRQQRLAVDGLAGRNTLTRLDQIFESPPDSAHHSSCCVNSRSPITVSSHRSGIVGGTAERSSADGGAPVSPSQAALARSGDVKRQLERAIHGLSNILNLQRDAHGSWPESTDVRALQTHFHLQQGDHGLEQELLRLLHVYRDMLQSLTDASRYFIDGAPQGLTAAWQLGNDALHDYPDGDPKKVIRFLPIFATYGPRNQSFVVIHELAHFVHPENDHYAFEWPSPDGAEQDGTGNDGKPSRRAGHNYSQLSSQEATRNCDSYAQFCLHVSGGSDKRLHRTVAGPPESFTE